MPALHRLNTAVEGVAPIEARTSRIQGIGIFALRPFSPGERIWRVRIVREITPQAPVREDLGERIEHCAYPNGKIVLVAFPERHINHSCDPNAYEHFDESGSCLVSRRSIALGEEITIDYNINIAGGTAWTCRCGAARCLGTVMGDFFLLPVERQREYRPVLAEWFVRRYRERLDSADLAPRK